MPQVWKGETTYRLEISMHNSQVVHALQASSYSYQLFAMEVRDDE